MQSGYGHDASSRAVVAEPRAVDGVNAWPELDVGDVDAHLRQGLARRSSSYEHPVEIGERARRRE